MVNLLGEVAAAISIVKAAMGILKKGVDVRIEKVLHKKINNKWLTVTILSNYGNKEASKCKCYVNKDDKRLQALCLPRVEELGIGATYAEEEFSIPAGGVKEVRGYTEEDLRGAEVVLEVGGKVQSKVLIYSK